MSSTTTTEATQTEATFAGPTAAGVPHLRVIELKPADSLGDLSLPNDPYFIDEPQPGWFGRWGLFFFLFFLPTLIGGTYYGFIASDQYASEASYYVRSSTSSDSGGPIAILSPSGSFTRSQEDTHALNEYLRSRDMVEILIKEDGLRDILSRPGADFFARFPNMYSKDNKEAIFNHFKRFVSVSVDGSSGISTLEVRAFNAQDSQRLAIALLKHGETLVNNLNMRAQTDAVRIAEAEVKQAEKRLEGFQEQMSEFRNRAMVLDPIKQSTAMLAGVTKLATEVSSLQAQLAQMLATAPNSPQIMPMRERIKAMQGQVEAQRAQIVGGDQSMSAKIVEFDRLTLQRELAVKALASAFISLESARHDAQKQQLYLETITKPHLSDQATYPKRLMMILIITLLSFTMYWLVNSIVTIMKEHKP